MWLNTLEYTGTMGEQTFMKLLYITTIYLVKLICGKRRKNLHQVM